MTLTSSQQTEVKILLKQSLRSKFQNYKPESTAMPFHTRLLGKDRLALYSFIHSLNTNFGTTIFEPVALAIAKKKFKNAQRGVSLPKNIHVRAQQTIQEIIDGLGTAALTPNKLKEVALLKQAASGEVRTTKATKIDLLLETHGGDLYLFDLKTAKPNSGEFKGFKRTLLEWVAIKYAENKNLTVNSAIAIPYNPYEPEPYQRWTLRGLFDLERELLVGKEFWDFVGGEGTYESLLRCFEQVGVELRSEIDDYFSRFRPL